MDSPLFWNIPSRPRYYSPVARSVPVDRHPPAGREIPVRRQSAAAPKVVSVPVQFVGSERSRSDSAVKIQKVFRGFLARKGVKTVMALRKEVDEIEKRISDEETVELMRRPGSKERIKMIEGLMNLLFRLDSVRGIGSGVRDCRKATIKKAIALQEAIDAIVAGESVRGASIADEAPEDKDPASDNSDSSSNTDSGAIEEAQSVPPDSMPTNPNPQFEQETQENQENLESATEPEIDENSDDTSTKESVRTIESNNEADPPVNSPNIKETDLGMDLRSDRAVENHKFLEKMMNENGRMVGLMEELVEKNEKQSRLLNALSQRVEMLERAFVCDKLRKSKKKRRSC